MDKSHIEKILKLKDHGVGWYIKFEVNTVLNKWNCMIYNKNQERKNSVEKVSVWDTPEQGIDWFYAWKMKDNEAIDEILKKNQR